MLGGHRGFAASASVGPGSDLNFCFQPLDEHSVKLLLRFDCAAYIEGDIDDKGFGRALDIQVCGGRCRVSPSWAVMVWNLSRAGTLSTSTKVW